jgi:hypothetical protein
MTKSQQIDKTANQWITTSVINIFLNILTDSHLSSSCVLCAQYFPSFSGLSILDCPFVFSLKFTLYFIRPHPHRNYQLEMKYNYIFLEVITTESVNIFRKIFITLHWQGCIYMSGGNTLFITVRWWIKYYDLI